MRKTALFITIISLCWMACNDRIEADISPCGYCPNNTICLEDECGCPPEKVDMGSWCMRRQDNLFVAKDMLGCPCFEPFGLAFYNIEPEQPGTFLPISSYGIESRETYNAGIVDNFSYYQQPDGDSISIFFMSLPKAGFPIICPFSETQKCSVHLGGRFVGPDSIRAEIRWILCSDPANIPESYHFWLIRQP